jgi:hypothetical protein
VRPETEKKTCRQREIPLTPSRVAATLHPMGDKSPKNNQKHAAQTKAKSGAANQKKAAASAAKQVVTKKK